MIGQVSAAARNIFSNFSCDLPITILWELLRHDDSSPESFLRARPPPRIQMSQPKQSPSPMLQHPMP